MSKIYEALQRVEQERLEAQEKRAKEPEALPAAASKPEEKPIAVAADLSSSPPAAESLLQQEPDAATVRPRDARKFDNVRKSAWKPMMEKLPALAERGSAVEQFRSLRSRLFAFRDMGTLKSILVSSGLPQEGKSFVAVNLAVSFARHKASRVLLIDGDMRRSTLHRLLGCESKPGLTTYLTGNASMTEIMQRAEPNTDKSPLSSGLGTLTFIGGGDEGEKAADLSGNPRFKELIDRAGEYFDWIIVDSSPVNLVTDGVNLAHACDGVLLVARGGVTKFETAQKALVELKASKMLGVVLNAVTTAPQKNAYYGYDSYDPEEVTAEVAEA